MTDRGGPTMMDFADIAGFSAACWSGALQLDDVVAAVQGRIEGCDRPEVWLARVSGEQLAARARQLESLRDGIVARGGAPLPLFGVPFAVKDNIDAAGLATTAGCPAYGRRPEASAPVVERLLSAGALLVGKTHMDQFATGLTGTRSPLGPCRNAHEPTRISGGSSSGSAVAVALDLVGFALGTDTAGSGRVPAALAGIVGLKPSFGRIPVAGVVPACRSLDCVSIFARTTRDAGRVLEVAAPEAGVPAATTLSGGFRFGVPDESFLGELDATCREGFAAAVAGLATIGGQRVAFHGSGLARVGALLYEGPFVAERHQAVGPFVDAHPEAVDPAVASILSAAAKISQADLDAGFRDLAPLRQQVNAIFDDADVIVLPTIPRIPSIEEVIREPLRVNAELGRFTNFMNLLGLCGCALPSAMGAAGVPAGVTLMAPGGHDARVLELAGRLESVLPVIPPPAASARRARIPLCVVGAHLRGMPLNPELTGCGGEFVTAVHTSPDYRLWHLAGSDPPKPGLERVRGDGCAIEGEVWALPAAAFGRFVDSVPRPLAIGHVTLEGGETVAGFVCESAGLAGAQDVSAFGGWRAYLASRSSAPRPGSR